MSILPNCRDVRQHVHCLSCHMQEEDFGEPLPYLMNVDRMWIQVCCKVGKDFAYYTKPNPKAFRKISKETPIGHLIETQKMGGSKTGARNGLKSAAQRNASK